MSTFNSDEARRFVNWMLPLWFAFVLSVGLASTAQPAPVTGQAFTLRTLAEFFFLCLLIGPFIGFYIYGGHDKTHRVCVCMAILSLALCVLLTPSVIQTNISPTHDCRVVFRLNTPARWRFDCAAQHYEATVFQIIDHAKFSHSLPTFGVANWLFAAWTIIFGFAAWRTRKPETKIAVQWPSDEH